MPEAWALLLVLPMRDAVVAFGPALDKWRAIKGQFAFRRYGGGRPGPAGPPSVDYFSSVTASKYGVLSGERQKPFT